MYPVPYIKNLQTQYPLSHAQEQVQLAIARLLLGRQVDSRYIPCTLYPNLQTLNPSPHAQELVQQAIACSRSGRQEAASSRQMLFAEGLAMPRHKVRRAPQKMSSV